jgi:type I restriction enzyme M protein
MTRKLWLIWAVGSAVQLACSSVQLVLGHYALGAAMVVVSMAVMVLTFRLVKLGSRHGFAQERPPMPDLLGRCPNSWAAHPGAEPEANASRRGASPWHASGCGAAMLDADFDRVLGEFRASKAVRDVGWATDGAAVDPAYKAGRTVRIRDVLARDDLSIDPKRWSDRCMRAREAVAKAPHFKLGDVLDVIPEVGSRGIVPSAEYKYIAIEQMSDGGGTPIPMRGWELPDRAKHEAKPGDIFVGGIWSSVETWFVASGDCSSLRVTNGCLRLRMKADRADYLTDVLAGLSTETYRIQARAFCTGSDGLADLAGEDLLDIVLPRVTDADARRALKPMVDALLSGRQTVAAAVAQLVRDGKMAGTPVAPRSSHMVQV